tara:strand:+ start:485 stop:1171 length:687 start_codon:yes stop_codon:yes gene_type:complete
MNDSKHPAVQKYFEQLHEIQGTIADNYHGQLSQDIFVDKVLDIDNGFFVDIGAGTDGIRNMPMSFFSNTYNLERDRSWKGIAIDYDEKYIDTAQHQRQCQCVCADLMKVNINDVLQEANCPSNVDYLSFDVDEAQLKVLNELDLSKYRFQIITYEHNLYQGCDKDHKMSRKKFKEAGYEILCGNVMLSNTNRAVEDWYVHSELFDQYARFQYNDMDHGAIISNIIRNK